jgi:hypothetical protein
MLFWTSFLLDFPQSVKLVGKPVIYISVVWFNDNTFVVNAWKALRDMEYRNLGKAVGDVDCQHFKKIFN